MLSDIILYSREQIAKENAAMTKCVEVVGERSIYQVTSSRICILCSSLLTAAHCCTVWSNPSFNADASKPEWFIVAIKAQDEPFELPMNPIT